MTVLPLPYPTDKWCETTLVPTEGHWAPTAGEISLDNSVFMKGAASIKIYSQFYNYYVGAIFTLNEIINANIYADVTLQFLMACNSGMTGTGRITLFDSTGKSASKTISNSNASIWQQQIARITIGIGGAGDFEAQAGFDWTKIKSVQISADQIGSGYPPQGGAFWVDELYFTFNVPDSILLIQSLPMGKSGTVTTSYLPDLFKPINFITPSIIDWSGTGGVPEGLPVTIQMDATNFDHWADAPTNANPTRTLTIPVNDLTLQAVYATQANPLLVIDSFDQNMDAYSATSAVKIVYQGTPQVVNVPMAGRVLKGSYSLTAIDTATRKFNHWKKPDSTTPTTPTITVDVQSDIRVEAHWVTTGNGDGKPPISLLLIVGVIGFGVVVGLGLLSLRKK